MPYPIIEPISDRSPRPLWSVMIPTYNGQAYLAETLRSILAQDPGPDLMQIEVVDDCSTEPGIDAIVEEIGQQRISLYRQPRNVGLGANWNTCIQRSIGHWVHILHQDDGVLPGFYQCLQAGLDQVPNLGAAFCRHAYVDSEGHPQGTATLERETPGVLPTWLEKIAVGNCMVCPATVVKRRVYETLGGFRPDLTCSLDWDMWKRITIHYPIWYEPEVLAYYRWHDRSESSRLMVLGENIADTRKAIDLAEAYLPPVVAHSLSEQSRIHHARFALFLARRLLAEGDPIAALRQIREAFLCTTSPQILQEFKTLMMAPNTEVLWDAIATLCKTAPPESWSTLLYQPRHTSQTDQARPAFQVLITPDWITNPEQSLHRLSQVLEAAIPQTQTPITFVIDTPAQDPSIPFALASLVMSFLESEASQPDHLEIIPLGELAEKERLSILASVNLSLLLDPEDWNRLQPFQLPPSVPCLSLDAFVQLIQV